MKRAAGCAAFTVLVLAACTSSTPAPEPTVGVTATAAPPSVPDRIETPVIGVVVAPQPDRDDVLVRLRQLAERRDDVTWWIGDAPSSDLVGELAGKFTDDGADVVCVVGVGRVDVVTELAVQVPRGRFCVGPTTVPEEAAPNVLYVDVRVQETAYLAGALAGLVDPRGTTGIITSRSSYRTGRQQSSFELGLAAVGAPPGVTVTGPVADDDAARDAATAQFDGDVSVVLGLTGAFDATLLEVASARAAARAAEADVDSDDEAEVAPPTPTGVIVGDDVVVQDDELPDEVLAIVRLLPERIVLPAVDRLLNGWEPGVASVGLTEGAVALDLAATPLASPHVDELNRIRGEVAAGDRDPG